MSPRWGFDVLKDTIYYRYAGPLGLMCNCKSIYMLNLLKKLLAGKSAPQAAALPAEFPAYVDKAIQLITASSGQLEDDELLGLFVAAGIPETEAIELLLFLPTAFCRHMPPQVGWPSYYVEYISEAKQVEIPYSSNLRFLAIQESMNSYLAGNFNQEDFLKIAGRNASYKALNQLLLAGGKLENAEVSPEYVVR